MSFPKLILCLMASAMLASCATPLTPQELKAQEAETAAARDYFSRKVELTDDGGDSSGYTTLELKNTAEGYILAYYGKDKAAPLYTEQVTECVGKSGPFPSLDCKLYNGVHRWAGFSYTVAAEDTVVKDPRLIPMQSRINVKKGDIIVMTRHSPQHWRFAGRFAQE
ncbi:hypothetical protein N8H71_27530 [Pseudomonas koreensis]|uniref:hypothetical protein n=1 Tax=Pseudomonas koreensis TaxID=198620 RepID=UPI0021C5D596|nr:hypothetical protein [Pseudomonas koreensis]MCU0075360.1 hypothetical protein [Pseudomonas koreensis]